MPSPNRSLIQPSTTALDSTLISESEYTADIDGSHRQKNPSSLPRWCPRFSESFGVSRVSEHFPQTLKGTSTHIESRDRDLKQENNGAIWLNWVTVIWRGL